MLTRKYIKVETALLYYIHSKKWERYATQRLRETLAKHNVEDRPLLEAYIQSSIGCMCLLIELDLWNSARKRLHSSGCVDIGTDIFDRVLFLVSYNKMTAWEQDEVIEIVRKCFD